jgi:hypothetical protein
MGPYPHPVMGSYGSPNQMFASHSSSNMSTLTGPYFLPPYVNAQVYGMGQQPPGTHPQAIELPRLTHEGNPSPPKRMRLSTAFLFPDWPKKNDECWHEKAIASIIYNLNNLNSQNMEKRFVQKIGNCSAFGIVAIWCDLHKTTIYAENTAPPEIDLSCSCLTLLNDVISVESFKALKHTFFKHFEFDDTAGMFNEHKNIGQILIEYKTDIDKSSVFSCWSASEQKVLQANRSGEIVQNDPNVDALECSLVDCVRIVGMLE